MDLGLRDLESLLGVTERTIHEWIRDKGFPAYRIGHSYRFNRAEVNEWVLANRIPVAGGPLELGLTKRPASLAALLRRGGVFDGIEGDRVEAVIRGVLDAIPLPPGLDKGRVAASLLEREELMSTAVGRGIAIPHPRNPIISDIESESLSICYLARPVDFRAVDGEPVRTVMVLLSANAKHHLEALSRISHLCGRADFVALLEGRAPLEAVAALVEAAESGWAAARREHD